MNYKTNKLKGLKRSMAFILVWAMVFTSLGISGWGPSEVYADSPGRITCYLTVSDKGEIPEGTDARRIAQVAVNVTDQNNNDKFDIDDALYALHEGYYSGGAEVGYLSEEHPTLGLGIKKLWGDEGPSFGYYVNNASVYPLTAEVKSGDYITAFVYSDGTGYSDSYTKFDSFTKTVAVGEDVNLKLEKLGFDANFNSVWSDLTGASIYNLADESVTLGTTGDNGNTTISFPSVGTYYIKATHSSIIIVPPVCKIIAVEPDNYATVRIEGNGFGTNGTDIGINTVLKNTMVNLDAFSGEYKAIDVVNAALTGKNLKEAEGNSGFYTSFGGVSGVDGNHWSFMLNDESAPVGLDTQEILPGDDIVLMLTGSTPAPDYYMTVPYSYFKTVSSSSDLQWGFPYGEVTLALYSKKQIGWADPVWNVSPATKTSIYSNGSQAWTPSNELAITDNENGTATITLWGGADAGTYYFDISAEVDGATSAYTRAKMIYDGENAPVLTFSAPSANDTTLSELSLNFKGAAASNGMPYVGENGISVGNGTESLSIYATASAVGARMDVTYQGSESAVSDYTFGTNVDLTVGENTFKILVTNDTDTQVHTLIVKREAVEERNIPNEVESLINGVKTVTGNSPYTDWVLAMNGAGLSLTASQLETYLSSILIEVYDFVENNTHAPGRMAKHAIALTSLRIDPRQIPDLDGGEAIDLVSEAAVAYALGTPSPVYGAPYILSLYDLGNYEIPDGAASRVDLIDSILDAKDNWGKDGFGMVLPALAPYYNAAEGVNGVDVSKCNEVRGAVDRALASMSEAQTIDGGLGSPNSNTVATVITGLNAIDKDSNSLPAFVKGGTSLLMNLLSFKTADNKLGYTNANSANTFSTLQGFQALATWENLSNARSSNLYNFTKEIAPYTNWPDAKLLTGITVTTMPTTSTYAIGAAVTSPETDGMVVTATYNADASNTSEVAINECTFSNLDRSSSGTKTVTVEYQNKVANFYVTVKQSDGALPERETVSVSVDNGRSIIASNNNVTIEADVTSALDVLKTTLDNVGKTYVIRNGSYVAEIDGFGEFDSGENSGWLYSVNGVTPESTASNDYTLKNNDRVLWYYTLNYKKDSSSSAWQEEKEKASEILAKEDGQGAATVGVSKAEMDKLVRDGGSLKAKSSVATIEMDADTLKGIGNEMGKDIEIKAKKVDLSQREDISQEMKDKIGDRPVLDLTVMSGSKQISSFDGKVSVSVPYTLKEGEDPSAVVIYLLKDNGEIEIVKNAFFDSESGEVRFTTNHFSLYGIAHKDLGFTDILGHWAKDYITYLAARDYISGMTETSFAPDETLTRGQFVQLLANLSGSNLSEYGLIGLSSISDVESTDWFAPAVAWAIEEGIVKGSILPDGTISFSPEKSISRQDIAVMLNRYRDKIDKKEFPEAVKEKVFQDSDQIGDYAVEAVKALQKSGIIQGKSQMIFAPLDQAKRGEAAKMIQGMLKLN